MSTTILQTTQLIRGLHEQNAELLRALELNNRQLADLVGFSEESTVTLRSEQINPLLEDRTDVYQNNVAGLFGKQKLVFDYAMEHGGHFDLPAFRKYYLKNKLGGKTFAETSVYATLRQLVAQGMLQKIAIGEYIVPAPATRTAGA